MNSKHDLLQRVRWIGAECGGGTHHCSEVREVFTLVGGTAGYYVEHSDVNFPLELWRCCVAEIFWNRRMATGPPMNKC